MNYITLDLDVQHADIRQTWYIASPCCIFQASMFAHNIGRQIGTFPTRVGYIHHDYIPNGVLKYNTLYVNAQKGYTNINSNRLKDSSPKAFTHPEIKSHIKLTLVLEFEDDIDLDDLDSIIHRSRFSGGNIISHRIKEFYSLDMVLKQNKRGFCVVDRKDLLDGCDNKLKRAFDLLYRKRDDKTFVNEHSWLSLTKIGYTLCSEPEHKKGIRNGYSYKHALAEPLVGLVQLLSMRELETFPMWEFNVNNDNFICQSTF